MYSILPRTPGFSDYPVDPRTRTTHTAVHGRCKHNAGRRPPLTRILAIHLVSIAIGFELEHLMILETVNEGAGTPLPSRHCRNYHSQV
jgi:hypothetical protein